MNVVGDHLAVASRSDLFQRKPHLQGTKAARVLGPVIDVVRGALIEVVVRRMVRKRRAQLFRIAHERAARLERRVQPLVRIDGYGIGFAQRAQIVRRLGHRRRKTAICPVDVEPDAMLAAYSCDLAQRIDRAGADRTRGADDEARHVTGSAIGIELAAQRRHIHAQLGVGWNPANAVASNAAQIRGLLDPRMRFDRRVNAKRPTPPTPPPPPPPPLPAPETTPSSPSFPPGPAAPP